MALSHFIFSFRLEKEKDKSYTDKSYTVIFFPATNDPEIDLTDLVKDYFTNNPPTNICILLVPKFHKEIVEEWIKAKNSIVNRILAYTYDKKVVLISYDETGKIESSEPSSASIISSLKEIGCLKIFEKRSGLLDADDTFHYILPSGRHSHQFIRVANVLSNGTEITFMAFCLLPFFRDNIKYIYCDTASINNVAFALVLLKSKLLTKQGLDFNEPIIESFGGYENLDTNSFDKDNCLVFISASNSGSLKKVISKKIGIDGKSIITLIYNGDPHGDTNIVLNLGRLPIKSKLRIDSNTTYANEVDCPYCNKNSIPVKLQGDQFLPAKSVIDRVSILKFHRPAWLNKFMEQFYGKEIIKCHFGTEERKTREFYLDLEKVHDEIEIEFKHKFVKEKNRKKNDYTTEFYKFLENNLPITVAYILPLPDKASEKMASQIQEYLKKKSCTAEIVKFKDFTDGKVKLEQEAVGTMLVVSSSIATGKKLYQLSLKFRDFDDLSVYYFFGICRTPDKDLYVTLEKDLSYRKDIINVNKVSSLENIHIPDRHTDFGKELENSPWEVERRFLNDSFIPFLQKNSYPASLFEARRNLILDARSTLGMYEKIFYPKLQDNTELSLRKNFAFFDFDYELEKASRPVSQADVYFTISAILHNLRNKNEDGKYSLFQHEHRRSVLAPQTFERYSDGVIQACYLRAAQPGELNYSIDFNLSYDFKKIILSIFDDLGSDDSEALYEFLYAISIGKIKMLKRDLADFVSFIEGKYASIENVKSFLEYIKNNNMALS